MVGGTQYVERRRAPQTVPVGGRRRGSPSPPPTPPGQQASYGFSNKNELQQGFNGNMPQKTSYGYSGTGVKKNSMIPVVMAGTALAGGTLIAGAVGGHYLAQRMSENDFGGSSQDVSWCRVPSGQGANSGKMIRCFDCQQKYGPSCQSMNACFRPGGCLFNITSDSTQDILMSTGFTPGDFAPPLKLRITKISGPQLTPSNVCPPVQPSTFNTQWLAASSFSVDFFVTLKEVNQAPVPLPTNQNKGKADGAICTNAPLANIFLWVFLLSGWRHR